MTPKFTIGKQRLHITEKYLCNGHWLVKREACNSPLAPKALKPLLSVRSGTYYDGIAGGLSIDTTPDMDQVIPKRDGFLPMTGPVEVTFRGDDIQAYVFACGDFKIGVGPEYVPIVRMGNAFAKDKGSAILVLDSQDLNGELVAVVMPRRL